VAVNSKGIGYINPAGGVGFANPPTFAADTSGVIYMSGTYQQ
jgi:hypothetical protein